MSEENRFHECLTIPVAGLQETTFLWIVLQNLSASIFFIHSHRSLTTTEHNSCFSQYLKVVLLSVLIALLQISGAQQWIKAKITSCFYTVLCELGGGDACHGFPRSCKGFCLLYEKHVSHTYHTKE